jgi:urease accessory protein
MIPISMYSRLRVRGLRAVLTVLIATSSGLAWAHPGHDGGFLQGLLHPIHGLDHLLAAVAVGIWGARLGTLSAWALPVAFVAAMAAGAALGISGFAMPLTEAAIALSVLALGALIALDARLRPALGVGLISAFGLFHGGAHGAEAAGELWGYTVGIVLGTAALHASGVGAAIALKSRPLVLRMSAAPVAVTGLALLVNRLA